MDRQQIIKALECWASGKPCEGGVCDLYDASTFICDRWTGKNALALINSQEQKIFELENRLIECENGYEGTLALERAKVKELTEEVADWKEIAEGYQKQFEGCAEDRAKLTEEIVKARNDGFDTVDYAIDKIRQTRYEAIRKALDTVMRIALSDEYGAYVDEEIAREICNRAAEALGKEQI